VSLIRMVDDRRSCGRFPQRYQASVLPSLTAPLPCQDSVQVDSAADKWNGLRYFVALHIRIRYRLILLLISEIVCFTS
jgi:hypothetical protein